MDTPGPVSPRTRWLLIYISKTRTTRTKKAKKLGQDRKGTHKIKDRLRPTSTVMDSKPTFENEKY